MVLTYLLLRTELQSIVPTMAIKKNESEKRKITNFSFCKDVNFISYFHLGLELRHNFIFNEGANLKNHY